MERLTYWNEEYGCWSYKCASGDAAKRLAAYEDTGLTPEQIQSLTADKDELAGKLMRYDSKAVLLRQIVKGIKAAVIPVSTTGENMAYDLAEKAIKAIDALLGGKEE